MEISTDLNPLKHRQQAAWASGDRALVVPSDYLEIVITRSPS